MAGIIKGLGAIIVAVVGGLAVWWLTTDPNSPILTPTPPPPITSPAIYSRGTKTTQFEGVYIPPSQSNQDGPYVFRNLDLDQGVDTSSPQGDVSLTVDARNRVVWFTASRATRLGSSQVTHGNCESRLNSNRSEVTVESSQFPSDYICLNTDGGRISAFRLVSINRSGGGSDSYTVSVSFEYTTWEWE